MSSCMEFDYYYGMEAEQFSFYRIPKILIKDERFRGLSSDAKLLYGLMLDRMSLSIKNGWLDGQNRAYIYYTLEKVMEDLGCCKDKCVRILAELDAKKGIGLIEKKRQGLGKPDIIYVKNFVAVEAEKGQDDMGDSVKGEKDQAQLEDVSELNVPGQSGDVCAAAVSGHTENACETAASSYTDGAVFPELTGKDMDLKLTGNDHVSDVSGQVWNDSLKKFSSQPLDASFTALSGNGEENAGGSQSSGVVHFGRDLARLEENLADKGLAQLPECADIAEAVAETDCMDMEKQTCRSLKNRPAEVWETDLQKSEKQTCGSLGNRLLGNEAGSGQKMGGVNGRDQENRLAEIGETDLQKSEKQTSGNRKNRLLEVGETDFWKSEKQTCRNRKNRLSEVGETDLQKSEKQTFRSRKDGLAEVGKADANYTENNYTEWNNTDVTETGASHTELNKKEKNKAGSGSKINPIHQSCQTGAPSIYPSGWGLEGRSGWKTVQTDQMEKAESYMDLIKQNIEYDHFMKYGNPGSKELFDNLYGVICSVVCADCEMIRISGAAYPHEMVKARFLKLNRTHMEYVMHCLGKNTGRVYNINEYLKASLFNAPNTIDSYYQQEVRHDMYGGGWAENGVI